MDFMDFWMDFLDFYVKTMILNTLCTFYKQIFMKKPSKLVKNARNSHFTKKLFEKFDTKLF